MLLDVCLGTRTAWKILFVLISAPGKAITHKQIKDMTRLGHKLDKYLLLLEKSGLVRKRKVGRRFHYVFNMTSPYAEYLIALYKQERNDYNAVDFEIITILREFVYGLIQFNFKNISRILLFGSYVKRTYHKGSDIDVAIIAKEKIAVGEQLLHTHLVSELEKRFGKEIQLHYFTEEEFEEGLKKNHKLVTEIATDGVALVG